MDDARLCVEVVRTAALNGAVVANYVEAVGVREGGRPGPRRAGAGPAGRPRGAHPARQTLNAAGPWGDAVRRLAGDDAGPSLRPTKGVHVLAPGRGLTAAFLLLHPADGRVFFVIPWLGKTLIGTTDTVCDDPPDALSGRAGRCGLSAEGHNHYFRPPLSPSDLLAASSGCGRWCGRGRASRRPCRASSPVGVAVGAAHRLRRQVHDLSPHGRGRRSTPWSAGSACAAAAARAISGWTGRRGAVGAVRAGRRDSAAISDTE